MLRSQYCTPIFTDNFTGNAGAIRGIEFVANTAIRELHNSVSLEFGSVDNLFIKFAKDLRRYRKVKEFLGRNNLTFNLGGKSYGEGMRSRKYLVYNSQLDIT